MNARETGRAFLRREARTQRGTLLLVPVLAGAVVAALLLLPPWARTLVREVIPAGELRPLSLHLALGVAIVAAVAIATFARDYLLLTICTRLTASLREAMAERALLRPLGSDGGPSRQELGIRLAHDLPVLHHALVRGLAVFAPNALTTFVLLAAMAVVSLPLLAGTLALALPMLAVVNLFGSRLHVAVRASQSRAADLHTLVGDALDGAKEAKIFRREGFLAERARGVSREGLRLALAEERLATLHPAAVTLVGIAGLAGLVLVAAWLTSRGVVSAGALVEFLTLLAVAVGPLQETVRATGALARFFAVLERCAEVLAADVEDDAPGATPLPAGPGLLELDACVVRYPSTGIALGPLSLRIEPGETVAIVGASGAGKSTMLDLIPRLLSPTDGTVRIDGHDVARHTRSSVRSRIALVTQQPFLFPGTVRENVRFGGASATDDEVQRACRLAHADEFVRRMPQGYDTIVERGGANLSVGQRQRLALARAILADPAILLLDEPTSALDEESERLIEASLREFRAGRTTLIVTHRPALSALADRIVEIESGRVVGERAGRRASFDAARA